MTEYVCPNCRGGFPNLDDGACPWCGESAGGEYERTEPMLATARELPRPSKRTQTTVVTKNRDGSKNGDRGPLRKLMEVFE